MFAEARVETGSFDLPMLNVFTFISLVYIFSSRL